MEDSSIARLRRELDAKNDEVNAARAKLGVATEQLQEWRGNAERATKKYEALRKEFEEYKELKLREKEEEIVRMKMEQKKAEMKAIERDNLSAIKQQLYSMAQKSKLLGTAPEEFNTQYNSTAQH